MNRKLVVQSTLLGLSLGFITSCGQKPNQEGGAPAALEVPVMTLQEENGILTKTYASSIEGVVNVEIRPQVSGYLAKIFVDEGAFVRAGQTLFQVDDRTYKEQYKNAQASILAAKANLSNVKIDLDRKKELVSNKLVSNLQVDQAQATYEGAQAALAQANAVFETAKINLEFCTIKATVSGTIGRIPYRLGSLINPAAVEPLTLLSDTHAVFAYFSMSENDFVNFQAALPGNSVAEKLKQAAPVTLKTANGQDFPHLGKIDAIEGQFDKNTGSISLRAKFENPQGQLRTGNTGKIALDQHIEQVVVVPITATTAIQDKIYVFTISKEGKAVQTPIEVSGKQESQYFVKSGVTAGDQIITNGLSFLQNGMPVKVKSATTVKDSVNKS